MSYTSGVVAGPGAEGAEERQAAGEGEREQDTLLWAIILLLGGVSF